jgi:hypothetical protein
LLAFSGVVLARARFLHAYYYIQKRDLQRSDLSSYLLADAGLVVTDAALDLSLGIGEHH